MHHICVNYDEFFHDPHSKKLSTVTDNQALTANSNFSAAHSPTEPMTDHIDNPNLTPEEEQEKFKKDAIQQVGGNGR